MKTIARSLLVLASLIAATGCSATTASEDETGSSADEVSQKRPATGITWSAVSLPNNALDGAVTIDDVVFPNDRDGNPVLKDGKPMMYVLERVGKKPLDTNGSTPRIDPGVVLVLQSNNGGETFTVKGQLPGLGFPAKLYVAPVATTYPASDYGQTIYITAPGEDTGLSAITPSFHAQTLRSDNGGMTFMSLPGGVVDLQIANNFPKTLTGFDCRGELRSEDGALTWTELGRGPLSGDCSHPRRFKSNDPNRQYASFAFGDFGFTYLFRSIDRGQSWQRLSDEFAPTTVLVDPLDSNHLWATKYLGFSSSADGGETFVSHNRGLTPDGNPEGGYGLSNVALDDLHRAPGNEKHTLWLGNGKSIVRWAPDQSADGGSWKEVSSLPAIATKSLAIAGNVSVPVAYAVGIQQGGSETLFHGKFTY